MPNRITAQSWDVIFTARRVPFRWLPGVKNEKPIGARSRFTRSVSCFNIPSGSTIRLREKYPGINFIAEPRDVARILSRINFIFGSATTARIHTRIGSICVAVILSEPGLYFRSTLINSPYGLFFAFSSKHWCSIDISLHRRAVRIRDARLKIAVDSNRRTQIE